MGKGREKSPKRFKKGKKKKTKKTSVPLQVYRFPKVEAKEIYKADTTLFPAVGTTTWNALVLLNAVAQGAGDNQYVGRKLLMKSIFFRWQVGRTTSITGGSPIRILIFYDASTDGGTPTIGGGSGSTVLTTDAICALMNLDNTKRFSVIFDETVMLDSSSFGSAYIERYKKLNHEMCFIDVNANISSIGKGSIWATVCQNGKIITTALQSTFESRIRFVDA